MSALRAVALLAAALAAACASAPVADAELARLAREPHRTPSNVACDPHRHPLETLAFWAQANGCEPERVSGRGSAATGASAAPGTVTVRRRTSSPAAGRAGRARPCSPPSACAMAAMCSGVLPQQPPAMFTKPL